MCVDKNLLLLLFNLGLLQIILLINDFFFVDFYNLFKLSK